MNCTDCNTKIAAYDSENIFTWCTNCGNYGVIGALKRALVTSKLEPHEVLLCFDIGCNGNGADKIDGYRFHGLHGRVIPFAAGASLANNKVKVIASAGDGATLSEGINHLIHAARHNYNMTFILHNNHNYALTKGQASATSAKGKLMSMNPEGVMLDPLDPLNLVLHLKPSFAARTFSGDIKHMQATMEQAITHKGFAYVEVLQHCPTFNGENSQEWYWENTYDITTRSDYDPTDLNKAKLLAEENDKLGLGIFYQDKERLDQYQLFASRASTKTELVDEVASKSISSLLSKFK